MTNSKYGFLHLIIQDKIEGKRGPRHRSMGQNTECRIVFWPKYEGVLNDADYEYNIGILRKQNGC